MPWELDESAATFSKIASSKQYINKNDNIYIETCLNLSSYIINWEKSQFPKQFFIDKYNYISNSLYELEHKKNIYIDDKLYGHLDFQREIIEPKIDYYIGICPDVYFHPHTLFYMIENAKNIKDEYFLISTEIPKLWDSTWDILTNKNFKNIEYLNWNKQSINNLIYFSENNDNLPYIEKINQFKWAGWFELYNKNFYEKLVPCFNTWHGYGPWDFFGIIVCGIAKKDFKIDVNQYILRNQLIFDKNVGIFQNDTNPSPYKKYLCLNDIPNQRDEFMSKMNEYINNWIEYIKTNNSFKNSE